MTTEAKRLLNKRAYQRRLAARAVPGAKQLRLFLQEFPDPHGYTDDLDPDPDQAHVLDSISAPATVPINFSDAMVVESPSEIPSQSTSSQMVTRRAGRRAAQQRLDQAETTNLNDAMESQELAEISNEAPTNVSPSLAAFQPLFQQSEAEEEGEGDEQRDVGGEEQGLNEDADTDEDEDEDEKTERLLTDFTAKFMHVSTVHKVSQAGRAAMLRLFVENFETFKYLKEHRKKGWHANTFERITNEHAPTVTLKLKVIVALPLEVPNYIPSSYF